MMDTMVQPGDTEDGGGGRVLSIPWPHLQAAQVPSFSPTGLWRLLSLGRQGALCAFPRMSECMRHYQHLLAKDGVGAVLGVWVLSQSDPAPFTQPFFWCEEKRLDPVPLAPA